MKKRNLIIGAVILIIILGVIILINNQDKMPLCIVDINKPVNKIGTCNTNADCPSYANICEMEAKQCMPANYITERNITYVPVPSKKECKILGGSWKLINKDLLNPR